MHPSQLKSLRDRVANLSRLTADDTKFVNGRFVQQTTLDIQSVLVEILDAIVALQLEFDTTDI